VLVISFESPLRALFLVAGSAEMKTQETGVPQDHEPDYTVLHDL
jgi:hypothetical protein